MRCLIDADILLYEIGSCGQYYEEEDVDKTNLIIRHPDFVMELLDNRIEHIMEECESTTPPTLYLTGDKNLCGKIGEEYVPNFRHAVATVKPYKGNRKDVVKPYHTDNILTYMLAMYDCKVANGYEADDLMMIDCYKDLDNTIICTRDKDLRQGGKHHFGWECGKQPQFGPKEIDSFGELTYDETKKTLKGEGIKFFYSQLLTGDTVDNIPGLPGCGPAKAFKLLDGIETELELYEAAKVAYEGKYGGDQQLHLERLCEQADLLWMCRGLDEMEAPIRWQIPEEENG